MKRIIVALLVSLLIGCGKGPAGGSADLKISVNAVSKFSTSQYTALVQLGNQSQLSVTGSGTVVADLGIVPGGSYTLTVNVYETVNNTPVQPIYTTTQQVIATGADQTVNISF